jgi:D-ribose pyranase
MLYSEILNTQLITLLSSLGHTQKICICDAGLPIPPGIPYIDLALTKNLPSIISVLDLIHSNLAIEAGTAASECEEKNAVFHHYLQEAHYPITYLSHEKFKQESRDCIAFVRTGECTPYANIILTAGVLF